MTRDPQDAFPPFVPVACPIGPWLRASAWPWGTPLPWPERQRLVPIPGGVLVDQRSARVAEITADRTDQECPSGARHLQMNLGSRLTGVRFLIHDVTRSLAPLASLCPPYYAQLTIRAPGVGEW